MKTTIQSLHFDADKKLNDFAELRIAKLSKFDDSLTSCDVIMKIDKNRTDGNKSVVINISGKGYDLSSDRQAQSFEQAIDECIDALKRQIEKRKA